MVEQDLKSAIETIKKESPSRKFVESVDVANKINLIGFMVPAPAPFPILGCWGWQQPPASKMNMHEVLVCRISTLLPVKYRNAHLRYK